MFQILPLSQKWPKPAQLIASGRLDANHFVALLGKEARGISAAQGREIDDAEHLNVSFLRADELFIGKYRRRVAAPQDDLLLRVQNLFLLADIDA